MVVLVRVAAEGRGLIYTSASFSGQSDFVSQKFCICVNTVVTKSACPTAAEKRLSASICLCRRCRSQPLSSVSRKQRYNTLDFPTENRVPSGTPSPLDTPAKGNAVSLWIPYANRDAARPYWKPRAKGALPLWTPRLSMQWRSILLPHDGYAPARTGKTGTEVCPNSG